MDADGDEHADRSAVGSDHATARVAGQRRSDGVDVVGVARRRRNGAACRDRLPEEQTLPEPVQQCRARGPLGVEACRTAEVAQRRVGRDTGIEPDEREVVRFEQDGVSELADAPPVSVLGCRTAARTPRPFAGAACERPVTEDAVARGGHVVASVATAEKEGERALADLAAHDGSRAHARARTGCNGKRRHASFRGSTTPLGTFARRHAAGRPRAPLATRPAVRAAGRRAGAVAGPVVVLTTRVARRGLGSLASDPLPASAFGAEQGAAAAHASARTASAVPSHVVRAGAALRSPRPRQEAAAVAHEACPPRASRRRATVARAALLARLRLGGRRRGTTSRSCACARAGAG
ncbi:hypothetical protein HRbin41_00646 [bacterium HR41]|nr:hypothetical protein HRbin41_00646 [bacterium HR41]